MNAQLDRTALFTYLIAGTLAVVAWMGGAFFLAVVCLLMGAGVAMAKPQLVNRQLVLQGTPVMLLLAVMLVSASGMVFAVDRVGELLAPPADVPDCTAFEIVELEVAAVL